MALYIDDGDEHHEWHEGEPWPKLKSRVITFQADGSELAIILDALRQYAKK
jgi:hypothetical protein